MEDFEEKIKQYAEKKVDKDGMIVYVPKEKYKRVSITFEKAKVIQQMQLPIPRKRTIIGPDGTEFKTIADVARHVNRQWTTVKAWVENKTNGWRYKDDEET